MKIAFLDSGLGGLLMMESIRENIPHHQYTYVGDTKNVPYGPKTPQEVLACIEPLLLSLLKDNDFVVLACNTACVKALPLFIKKYPHQGNKIINIAELTINAFQDNEIDYVLATLGTVSSGFYNNICDASFHYAMPGLVDVIEEQDMLAGISMVNDVVSYMKNPKEILLGCTHYLWLKKDLTQKYKYINWIGQDDLLLRYIRGFRQGKEAVEYYVTGDYVAYTQMHNINFRKYKNH